MGCPLLPGWLSRECLLLLNIFQFCLLSFYDDSVKDKLQGKSSEKSQCFFFTSFLWCDKTAQHYKASLQRDFSRDLLNCTYVAKFMNQVEVAFTRMHLYRKEEIFSKSNQWVTDELPNVSDLWWVQSLWAQLMHSAAQHRSPFVAWRYCSCVQRSCCRPVPSAATPREPMLWAQEVLSTTRETTVTNPCDQLPSSSLKWAAPCRSLHWDRVILAFSPLSSDTLTIPALSIPQMGAGKGQLLPWKPHLMAFLPAWIQAILTPHNKGLINCRHKAYTQDCWLLMLMNAFNVAILVVVIPVQPHY